MREPLRSVRSAEGTAAAPPRLRRSLSFGQVGLTMLSAVLGACGAEPEADQTSWSGGRQPPNQFFQPEEDVQLSYSQVLYVPVYSNILTGDGARPTEMAATFALRNTDRDSPIFVTSVAYYDTAGQLIETFLDGMFGLSPMASASIFINVSDTRGGFGANFIVEWGATEPVSEPLIEAVMVGSAGTKGFSFTSPARIIQSNEP